MSDDPPTVAAAAAAAAATKALFPYNSGQGNCKYTCYVFAFHYLERLFRLCVVHLPAQFMMLRFVQRMSSVQRDGSHERGGGHGWGGGDDQGDVALIAPARPLEQF